jgi:hypothetical protein
MKRFLPLLIVLAFVPSHVQALDTSGLRSLCAMPLAVDACARTGRVAPEQLGLYASRLNEADVPPPLFVETVRYAPVVVQQPDFFPFVDSEVSQGVVGDALVTVIEQRVRGYGYDVRRGNATPAWVLSDNYIPRFESSRTTRTSAYETRYDTRYDNAPRYDRRTMLYLIEMPLAVATVSEYGVPQDRLARFCGTLNRGYLPPEQFVDTVRYAPEVIVDRPDFVPFLDAQIGNGITGLRLFAVINRQLPSYRAPRQAFSPSYVLNDQYVPQPVRTRWAQARTNPAFAQPVYQQPAYQQPVYQQPVYQQPVAQPSYIPQPQPAYARQQQQRLRRQAPAVIRSVPQPAMIQSPQVVQMPAPQAVRIPPGQAKKEARQAQQQVQAQVREQGRGQGRGQERQRAIVQQQPQPVVIAPPPMISAAPPAPVMVAPPPQDNGHGHGKGPGGEGPPGQQKEKDKGGKGHGKD